MQEKQSERARERERAREQAEREVSTVVPKLGVRPPCGVPEKIYTNLIKHVRNITLKK